MRRLLTALGVWAAMTPLAAQEQTPLEYQVKAAYLYNFVKFIEWPAAARQGHDTVPVDRGAQGRQGHDQERPGRLDRVADQRFGRHDLEACRQVESPAQSRLRDEGVEHPPLPLSWSGWRRMGRA